MATSTDLILTVGRLNFLVCQYLFGLAYLAPKHLVLLLLPVVVVHHVLSVVVLHVPHVLHVRPWINIVGVATAHVAIAERILCVHAGD